MNAEIIKSRRGRPVLTEPSKTGLMLREALRAFCERGFEGTTLRHVAAAAGADPALVKYAFGSKLGMWEAVINSVADVLDAGMDEVRACIAKDPVERLEYALRVVIGIICHSPCLAYFMLQDVTATGQRARYIRERLVKPVNRVLVPLVGEARIALQLPAVDCVLLLSAGLSGVAYVAATRFPADITAQLEAHAASLQEELHPVVMTMILGARHCQVVDEQTCEGRTG
jgi:AcrR family transcriptional regulator